VQCKAGFCDLFPDLCTDREQEETAPTPAIRRGVLDDDSDDDEDDDDDDDLNVLEKRASGWMQFAGKGLTTGLERRVNWPSLGQLYRTRYRRGHVLPIVYRIANRTECPRRTVVRDRINVNVPQLDTGDETEHPVDVSALTFISSFVV
jgi:hypothetical protein